MLADDFPLLGLFWSFMFMFVMVGFVVIYTFVDNFRRTDHTGVATAGWALLSRDKGTSRRVDAGFWHPSHWAQLRGSRQRLGHSAASTA
jgi:hypothetical protein